MGLVFLLSWHDHPLFHNNNNTLSLSPPFPYNGISFLPAYWSHERANLISPSTASPASFLLQAWNEHKHASQNTVIALLNYIARWFPTILGLFIRFALLQRLKWCSRPIVSNSTNSDDINTRFEFQAFQLWTPIHYRKDLFHQYLVNNHTELVNQTVAIITGIPTLILHISHWLDTEQWILILSCNTAWGNLILIIWTTPSCVFCRYWAHGPHTGRLGPQLASLWYILCFCRLGPTDQIRNQSNNRGNIWKPAFDLDSICARVPQYPLASLPNSLASAGVWQIGWRSISANHFPNPWRTHFWA